LIAIKNGQKPIPSFFVVSINKRNPGSKIDDKRRFEKVRSEYINSYCLQSEPVIYPKEKKIDVIRITENLYKLFSLKGLKLAKIINEKIII
jgi:hypothetical protein